MHILIAPNAFKQALDATDAAKALERGFLTSRLSCTCECFPIGDGGNGTGELLTRHLDGKMISASATDPLGRPVTASFGWVEDSQTAVIEMASASGLHLLAPRELDPLHSSSYGTGQLMKAALDLRPRQLILAVGGSATVDAGCGILTALGVRFLDAQGNEIIDLPQGLEKLYDVDTSGLDSRMADCRVTVLCDVINPLLGEQGAAHVFGPQKGATPDTVKRLEAILTHFSTVVQNETEIRLGDLASGGAAGGVSAGLHAIIGAELVSGIDYFLQMTGFDRSLSRSDLVITAEGSIEEQTLRGKGPLGVAKRAQSRGIPVICLAGSIPLTVDETLNHYFDVLLAIGNRPASLEEALAETADNLQRTAVQLGNMLHRFR
mgnify:CR=1 FL=1|jgi:glycerate kinase